MSPPDTWISWTTGNPFTGHPVDEKVHTQDLLEDNISLARPGATLAGRTEGGRPGETKQVAARSAIPRMTTPWSLGN